MVSYSRANKRIDWGDIMDKCLCDLPNISIRNTHSTKRNMDLILLKDKEGTAIIILENNTAIGCFDINYCPKCGKKLKGAI